jgi:hypothetical protein
VEQFTFKQVVSDAFFDPDQGNNAWFFRKLNGVKAGRDTSWVFFKRLGGGVVPVGKFPGNLFFKHYF